MKRSSLFKDWSSFSVLVSVLFLLVACRDAGQHSDALTDANMAALEQTADMENKTVDTDNVLQFAHPVLDLGEIPLGESRDTVLRAINRSDLPLVLLDAYTSCQCTKVVWDKKPIEAGSKTLFEIHFTAEQPGVFFKKIAVRHSGGGVPATFAIEGVVANN